MYTHFYQTFILQNWSKQGYTVFLFLSKTLTVGTHLNRLGAEVLTIKMPTIKILSKKF